MTDAKSSEITDLLQAWREGDEQAREDLIPLVFDDLRRIARRQFDLEKPGHTLQPTALVNELYMKLIDQRRVSWDNRREFFAVAAKMIRRILVDHARKRRAAKRGSGGPKISLDEAIGVSLGEHPNVLALDDALKGLAKVDSRGSRVVELRIFGGLTLEEIAEVMEIGRSTVVRDWNFSKRWLKREMSRD